MRFPSEGHPLIKALAKAGVKYLPAVAHQFGTDVVVEYGQMQDPRFSVMWIEVMFRFDDSGYQLFISTDTKRADTAIAEDVRRIREELAMETD